MSWKEAKNPLTGIAEDHSLAARIKDIVGMGKTEIKPYLKECPSCSGIFYNKVAYDSHISFCVQTHQHLMTTITLPYSTELYEILKEQDKFFMQFITKPDNFQITIRKQDLRNFRNLLENNLIEINVRGRGFK